MGFIAKNRHKINVLNKKLIILLIIGLPIHYLVSEILFPNILILAVWKEIIIFYLLIITIILEYLDGFEQLKKIKSLIVMLIFGIIAFMYFCLAPNKIAAIDILRIYFQPIFLYYAIRKIRWKKNELINVLKVFIFESFIISFYGLFQSLVLGADFLIDLGYPIQESGKLSNSFYLSFITSFQRCAGTFVSPNVYAIYATLSIVALIFYRKYFNHIMYMFFLLIIILGFICTFSRSALLGLLLCAGCYFIIYKEELKEIISIKNLCRFLLLIIFAFGIMFLCLEVNVLGIAFDYLKNSLTLQDSSAVGHISSWESSIEICMNNFWGNGLGRNGQKAIKYFEVTYTTESSFFLLWYEFGFFGMLSYISIFVIAAYEDWKVKNITGKNTLCLGMYVIGALTFLPYIQDLEIMCFLFMLYAVNAEMSRLG